jgi:hypothetical protein
VDVQRLASPCHLKNYAYRFTMSIMQAVAVESCDLPHGRWSKRGRGPEASDGSSSQG